MSGRIFLANVGANTSHPFQSPIFDDGTFELLPIPEGRNYPGESLVRYSDFRSFNHPEESLLAGISRRGGGTGPATPTRSLTPVPTATIAM